MNNKRVDRVLANLAETGLSQALIVDPMSISYLTGYFTMPYERFLGLYLAAGEKPTLFANVLFPDASSCCDDVVTYSDTDDPMALVASRVRAGVPLGVDKNLEARWLLPLRDAQAASDFVLASGAVDRARSIKDAAEIDLMRRASALNDAAMGWLTTQLACGVTELQLAEGLLGEYRRLGAQGYSFSPIVSFGAHASDPHHEPDDTPLGEHDLVLFDVGCLLDGYCSDMTRTFFWGAEPSERDREVYETVRRANEAAEAIIKPGVTFAQIDLAARDIIEKAGYGEYFTHRLGHQIGMTEHEPGDVSSTHDEPVCAGQIFSIEPGIYLPEQMGVRIEDLVIVTDDGVEVINSYPKQLTVLGA